MEVLRREAGKNDPPEEVFERIVTGTFAALGSLSALGLRSLIQLRVWAGLEETVASVSISATDRVSGRALPPGAVTHGDVAFKFELSGRSKDFNEGDVEHDGCGVGARFLGMKRTYYLECPHPGTPQPATVWVPAHVFTVAGKTNAPSEQFRVIFA